MSTYDRLNTIASSLQPELVDLRRHLHQNPELGWHEINTSAFIQKKLRDRGFEIVNGFAKTGFYTEVDSGKPGPTVAWRADMDALPIDDEKGASYSSKIPGVSHMCGHDAHTTIAYGIARLLQIHKDEFKGKVRIFWQPAEEVQPSGAPVMIEDGILEGVEAVMAMHCDPHTESGKFSLRNGPETAAFDSFRVKIESPSTQHSARPHKGPDAMWVGHQVVQHLYQFIGRLVDPTDPTVISICEFHAGFAMNVIPRKVNLSGTIRTASGRKRMFIKEHIKELLQTLATLHHVQIDVEFGLGAPAVVNNDSLYNFAKKLIKKDIGNTAVVPREQSMGAEDFSFYTEKLPGLFLRVGTCNSPETSYPLHSSKFDIDENVLAPTATFVSHLIMKLLNQNYN